MNKQTTNGIEWLFVKLITGIVLAGYTWNVVTGCKHRCRWTMPDGTEAVCYAETIAEGLARASYPEGFEHHYFHADRLDEPLKLKEPAGIFLDSMGDLFGHWVSDEEIRAVLDIVRRAYWHTFFVLTKNAPRLRKFKDEFPPNLWVGVSMPPSKFMGREVSAHQQQAYMITALDVLEELAGYVSVRWISFEPLSFNVAQVIEVWMAAGTAINRKLPIEWGVIGAASRGRDYFQPDPVDVIALLDVLDRGLVRVFFKGNLEWEEWREDFPDWPIDVTPSPRQSTLPAELDQLRLF